MSLWKGWGSWLTEVQILMSSLMPLFFLLSSWPVQRTWPSHDQPTAGWSEADSQEVQGVEGHEHAAAPGHLSPAAGTSGPWRHPPGTQEPQLFWLCWKVTMSRSQDCSLPCSCAILQDTARAYILLTRKPQTQFLKASSLLPEDAARVKPVLMQWESWLPCVAPIDIGVTEFVRAGVSSVLLLGAARSARL